MRHHIAFTVRVEARAGRHPMMLAEHVLTKAGIIGYSAVEARFSETYADNLRIRMVCQADEERPEPETAITKRFYAGLLGDLIAGLGPDVRFVSLDSTSWVDRRPTLAAEAIRRLEAAEAEIKVRRIVKGVP